MKIPYVLVALVGLASSGSTALQNCGTLNDDMQVHSVTLTPSIPKAGQTLCVTIQGDLKTEVTEGALFHLVGSVFGIPIYDMTSNLCAELAQGTHPCPIPPAIAEGEPGVSATTQLTQCFMVPSDALTGFQFQVKATATNNGGTRLFCVEGPLTLSP